MISKPIKLDRIAGVIALLGALATGHSAFADTVNFSGGQVGAGLLSIGQNGTITAVENGSQWFQGNIPAYSVLTITIQGGAESASLYSSITSNGDAYINQEYLNLYNPYSYYIVAQVSDSPAGPGGAYDFYNPENVLPENSALILSMSFAPPTDPNQFITFTEFNDTPEVAYFEESDGFPGNFVADYSVSAATPLPATLPLLATGLGGLGLLGWRRKRKFTTEMV